MPEPAPLFPVARGHLVALNDGEGILQHAQGWQPDPNHGYCTDDVSRALMVDLLHGRVLGWTAVEGSAAGHLSFLADAFDEPAGRFRSLRTTSGRWVPETLSEDADGRALQALGETIASAPDLAARETACSLFERALPSVSGVRSIRPMAAVALACEAAVRGGSRGRVERVLEDVAAALLRTFERCAADPAWPWPDPVVTYENELPPRALIICGQRLGRPRMTEVGLAVLDWLIAVQTEADGHVSTEGNAGWWPAGGPRARFDQQPISTTSLLLASGAAYEVTGNPAYRDVMEAAYGWFLGRNDVHETIAEPASGACRDGIGPAGASRNRGAESTLMWQMAAERIRSLRAAQEPIPALSSAPEGPMVGGNS